MTSTLLTGISELWTLDPALDDPARPGGVGDEQVLQEAALVIEDGLIAWTGPVAQAPPADDIVEDRKSTRLNSSHVAISYAVFCLKKKKERKRTGRSRSREE